MDVLMFQPWIGENYGKSSYGKLLIIGESHYFYHEENDFQNFTKKVINGLGTSNDNDFFIKVGQLFDPENYLDVWSKVAFANAIQYQFSESRQPKTSAQIKTIEPAFREYLNIVKPEKVLVCSKLVWERGLPQSILWGKYLDTIRDERNQKGATLWELEYDGGKCLAIGIPHTSSIRPIKFKVEEWSALVNIFIDMKI